MDPDDEVYSFAWEAPSHPPDWVDGAPRSGIGQSCAFCGTREVAWVHPLASDLVSFRQYGKGHTLPGFWALCDRCEDIYATGDEDAAVEVMRSSDGWSMVADEHVEECVRKPLAVFRRADRGGRRFDPEPPGLVDARDHGFVPLRELTGVANKLGPLWPPDHRRWLDELGAVFGEEEDDEASDRWLVRAPWPSLTVGQTLAVLWRWVDRRPHPHDGEAWNARVLEVFAWSEAEALAIATSKP
jgi:hypothetical protein